MPTTKGGYRRASPGTVTSVKRDDNAAYMRAWRAARPELQAMTVERQAARDRALRRLGRMYPNLLDRLTEEELDRD